MTSLCPTAPCALVFVQIRPNLVVGSQSGFGGGGHSLDFRFLYGVVNSFLNSGLGVERPSVLIASGLFWITGRCVIDVAFLCVPPFSDAWCIHLSGRKATSQARGIEIWCEVTSFFHDHEARILGLVATQLHMKFGV